MVDDISTDGSRFYLGEHTIKVWDSEINDDVAADIYVNGVLAGRTAHPWYDPLGWFTDNELRYNFNEEGTYEILGVSTVDDKNDSISIVVSNLVDPDNPDAIVITALRESTWSYAIGNVTVKKGEKVCFVVAKQSTINSIWDWDRIDGAQVYINGQPAGYTAKTDFGAILGFGGQVGYVHEFDTPGTYEVYATSDQGTTQKLYVTVTDEEYSTSPIFDNPFFQFFQNLARQIPLFGDLTIDTFAWLFIALAGVSIVFRIVF